MDFRVWNNKGKNYMKVRSTIPEYNYYSSEERNGEVSVEINTPLLCTLTEKEIYEGDVITVNDKWYIVVIFIHENEKVGVPSKMNYFGSEETTVTKITEKDEKSLVYIGNTNVISYVLDTEEGPEHPKAKNIGRDILELAREKILAYRVKEVTDADKEREREE